MVRFRLPVIVSGHPLREDDVSPQLVVDPIGGQRTANVHDPHAGKLIDGQQFIQSQRRGVFSRSSLVARVGTGELGLDQNQVFPRQVQSNVRLGEWPIDR
ncbi:MAG: hypothetical protein DWQ35_13955 [Planctomycetota bacterium]|nr:MAG: hypothetical protein DWQ35_13955 [Planctomycetota bacterium]REK46932.1 MAG: hypothetical protein DWQ46_05400 [Planctomycetota bacterium]